MKKRSKDKKREKKNPHVETKVEESLEILFPAILSYPNSKILIPIHTGPIILNSTFLMYNLYVCLQSELINILSHEGVKVCGKR